MPTTAESLQAEAARIEQAYARRKSGNLYSRFNPAYLFMVQEREQRFLALLARHGCVSLDSKKILEVGCGGGDLLRDFIKWGARPENIVGIELLPERMAEAVELCPKAISIHQGNAARLPFTDESFDIVVQSTVFTSVLDPGMKEALASEMRRVLKPEGLILWYDYHMNNPRIQMSKASSGGKFTSCFPTATFTCNGSHWLRPSRGGLRPSPGSCAMT